MKEVVRAARGKGGNRQDMHKKAYPQGPITLEANPDQSLEDNIKLTQDLVETYHYDVDLYYDDLKLPIIPGSNQQQIIEQYHILKEHREASIKTMINSRTLSQRPDHGILLSNKRTDMRI